MRIFIGSSRESIAAADWVAVCLEDLGHEPLKWDEPGLFPPGEHTFLRLIDLSKKVDAAIFVFAEDDRIWYRGDAASQPRDNVLIEYGLFAGQLGASRSIICVNGRPRESTDLRGLTYLDIAEARRNRARAELRIWLNNLRKPALDTATLQLMAKLSEREREVEFLNRRLSFEGETLDQLEHLLTENNIIDFVHYDLEEDGHWKLLFYFDYFWRVSDELSRGFGFPRDCRDSLESAGLTSVASRIQWAGFETDAGHTAFFVRKALRVFRDDFPPEIYRRFIQALPIGMRDVIRTEATRHALRKGPPGSNPPTHETRSPADRAPR